MPVSRSRRFCQALLEDGQSGAALGLNHGIAGTGIAVLSLGIGID